MAKSARAYLREGWTAVRPAWPRAVLAVVVWALLTNAASLACFVPLLGQRGIGRAKLSYILTGSTEGPVWNFVSTAWRS